ncbi:unnamed protein product [Tilletia controversa]|nr:unnamed protein product [Tilletia controversa]
METNITAASIPGLTSVETFFKWRQTMEPILDGFRALLIVQGYNCCPTMPAIPSSTDLKLIEAWKDWDARARSLIQRTISGPMIAMTRALKSSSEMWLLLHDLNDLNTSDHRATINRRLANLFLEESGDMTEHLNTYMGMVAEAEAAERVAWITKRRPVIFALIKIYKEEDVARKRSSNRQIEAAAMKAVHNPKQTVKIKGDGHVRADCPITKHLGPLGIICWNCHEKGHVQTECPIDHAKAVCPEDEDILGALVEEHTRLTGESDPTIVAFMVDSGASRHIVEHKWMLSNSRSVPEIAFKTVGCKLKANKAGDIKGLPVQKLRRARYLLFKLKSVPPVESQASKNVLAAAQPTAERAESDPACPKAWEFSPQAEENDSHEVIRVEDFIEPDNDEELPAAEGQREKPREVVCTGDRPVYESPCHADCDQRPEGERQNFIMVIQELEGHLLPTDKDPFTYEEALTLPEPKARTYSYSYN